MKKFSFLIALTALLAIGMVSCVDQMFDEPPVTDLPQLKGNTTIDVLKKKHTIGATASKITEDLIIEGVVVADDRSGNFFENIVIQDGTGGISVRMNASGLYNTFPIGAKVAVKCKNLYIGDYNGVHQLNGSVTDAIEDLLIPQHVLVTAKDQTVTPTVLGIKDLNQTHINTLIKLENVEFAPADTNQTWADAVKLFSVNRNLQDCNGGTIIVRSSGYADFAKDKTPGKKGSLTAIYTVFGSTKQLIIRDPRDAAMTGVRCGGAGTGGGGQLMTIADLRGLFKGTTTSAPADRKIKGVVISDKAAGNTDPRNAIIQQGDAGIVVRFKNEHSFNLGQEIEVTVSGQELSAFNGLLQVNNVDNNLAKLNGAGQLPAPRVASAAQVVANLEKWESTLVKIVKGSFSASGTYSGSKTLTDSTGQVVVFTRSQATFSGSALPVGKNLDLVGIVSQFNTAQITPRNLSDIVVSTGGGGPSTNNLLDEAFSSGTANQAVKLTGWVNKSVTGTRTWLTKSFSGNFFAEATAFQSTDTENEMWLITPGLKAADAKTLSFESAQAFYKHDGLTVYISNDFDGTNIDKATWKKLTYKMPTAADANYDWVQSGNIDVSGYSGTIYIGFQHKGDKTTNTTTFRLDNVKVTK